MRLFRFLLIAWVLCLPGCEKETGALTEDAAEKVSRMKTLGEVENLLGSGRKVNAPENRKGIVPGVIHWYKWRGPKISVYVGVDGKNKVIDVSTFNN